MFVIFDTSTTDGIVAVADPDNLAIAGQRQYARMEGGTSLLLTGLEEILESNDLTKGALTGIVLNRGPGSYTGLRVGFALAQGLAESLDIPVVSIPSYSAFAIQYMESDTSLAVCYDARSRGIGWVTYLQGSSEPIHGEEHLANGQAGTEVLELGQERVLLRLAPPAALPGLIPRPCRLVGPAVAAFISHHEEPLPGDLELVTGSEHPGLEYLLQLGEENLQPGGEDRAQISPFYLGTLDTPKLRR
jgi:tRNA threonylcarbamoyl adenosine modification protein YeaZ